MIESFLARVARAEHDHRHQTENGDPAGQIAQKGAFTGKDVSHVPLHFLIQSTFNAQGALGVPDGVVQFRDDVYDNDGLGIAPVAAARG